jgi:type IV pilus assembly protein PilM
MLMSPERSRLLRMFPVPAFLRMPAVGFDISDHAIRIIEAIPSAVGLSLGRHGVYPLPAGVVVGGLIQDLAALTKLVETIKQEHRLTFIHASLPAEQAYIFSLMLENVPSLEDLRTAVEFKLEENIPIAPDEAVFDYVPLSREEPGLPPEVSVVTVPRAVVEVYTQLFRSSGLTPLSFETEMESLARAVVPATAKGSIMVIDFGALKTGISIVNRGAVQFTTMLEMGSTNLTAILEKALHVSTEEAEKIKYTRGFMQSEQNALIMDALMNPLSVLKDELGRYGEYWDTYGGKRLHHQPVERVLLVGGGANLLGLPEYLETALGLPVSRGNVWGNWFSFDGEIPAISFAESLSYATAIGLAMHT